MACQPLLGYLMPNNVIACKKKTYFKYAFAYDTRSIFQQNTFGLYSVFFFSYINCIIKAKKTVCPTTYP